MKSVRIRSFSGPYLVRMRENTDQKNSEYEHFSRSVSYSINRLISFYLKRHVIEHSAGFAFCRLIRMSLIYKIGKNDFNVIFKILSYVSSKLYCDKYIFQIICLNYEIASYFSIGTFFPKTSSLNNFKSKRVL